MNDSNQVVLIGLDGLGLTAVGEWIEDGTLSTLRSLRREGTIADLESTTPPWTPCAWPSLLSGRDPGEHGVFDFFTRNGYEKSLVDRGNVRAPYLWEVADACGLTTIAINFPVTHPATELEHGALVPGYLAPEETPLHPPEIREAFESRYGEYHIYPEYNATSDAVEKYVRVARSRRDMAELLDERFEWDLLAVQFQVTDSVFHDLDDRDRIKQVLQAVDSYVGDVIALADAEPSVFVASDHGMGEYEWTFYVNTWLADHGYCRTTAGDPEYFVAKKKELGTEDDATSPLNELMKRVAAGFSSVGVTPRGVHRALSAVGLAERVERMFPDEVLSAAQNRTVDWNESLAFQIFFNSLGVHLNVKGREPSGLVPQDRYDEVRDGLMAELEAVTDPDGSKVFEAVKPREDVYAGRNVELAPDIVLVPREYEYDVSGSIVDQFRRNAHMNHKPDGLFLTNRSTTNDTGVGHASIYDVAPTVAACLGIPPDMEADGRVLPVVNGIDEPEAWRSIAEPLRPEPKTGSSDDEAVEQRLADLGYLE